MAVGPSLCLRVMPFGRTEQSKRNCTAVCVEFSEDKMRFLIFSEISVFSDRAVIILVLISLRDAQKKSK